MVKKIMMTLLLGGFLNVCEPNAMESSNNTKSNDVDQIVEIIQDYGLKKDDEESMKTLWHVLREKNINLYFNLTRELVNEAFEKVESEGKQKPQEQKRRELTPTEKENAYKMWLMKQAVEKGAKEATLPEIPKSDQSIVRRKLPEIPKGDQSIVRRKLPEIPKDAQNVSGENLPEVPKDVQNVIGGKLHELSNLILNGELLYSPYKMKMSYGQEVYIPGEETTHFNIIDLLKEDGSIDLSNTEVFGDASKYLLITTDPEKFFSFNKDGKRLVVLIAPRFLIEEKMQSKAKFFKPIMDQWKEDQAPIGIFYRMEFWNIDVYNYLTKANLISISNKSLGDLLSAAKDRPLTPDYSEWAEGSKEAGMMGRARFYLGQFRVYFKK